MKLLIWLSSFSLLELVTSGPHGFYLCGKLGTATAAVDVTVRTVPVARLVLELGEASVSLVASETPDCDIGKRGTHVDVGYRELGGIGMDDGTSVRIVKRFPPDDWEYHGGRTSGLSGLFVIRKESFLIN